MTLILCPLVLEIKYFLEKLREENIPYTEKQVGPLKVYECKDQNWLIAQGGHGKTQFAVHTQFLIHQLEGVDKVICAGCAGAMSRDFKVYDLVIADKTIEHDFQLRFFKRPDPEFPADQNLVEGLQQAAKKLTNKKFNVFTGIIASGDEDIVDAARVQELIEQTKAVAVAWEGAGGARACKLSDIAYVELRGFTDTADSNKMPNFEQDLKIVMSNIVQLLLRL